MGLDMTMLTLVTDNFFTEHIQFILLIILIIFGIIIAAIKIK